MDVTDRLERSLSQCMVMMSLAVSMNVITLVFLIGNWR